MPVSTPSPWLSSYAEGVPRRQVRVALSNA